MKSGKQAAFVVRDRAVARVVRQLHARGGARLFAVDGARVDSAEVNTLLAELTEAHITAKDFRTWRGTSTAFGHLRAHVDELTSGTRRERERIVLAAVDTVAQALSNARAVARSHYVHPHLLRTCAEGSIGSDLEATQPRPHPLLSTDEAWLAGRPGRRCCSSGPRRAGSRWRPAGRPGHLRRS